MVRNFWLEARIDGRKNPLNGGPWRKVGGFDLVITQRHQGTIQEAVSILGQVHEESLVLTIVPCGSLRWEWKGDRLVIYSER